MWGLISVLAHLEAVSELYDSKDFSPLCLILHRLRVDFRTPLPPRSFLLFGGAAGRRGDGIGGWLSLYIVGVDLVIEYAYMAYGALPLRSLLPAQSSCDWWLAATESSVMAVWCGGKLEMPELESLLNKLELHRFRAGRRGGGARKVFAASSATCGFPSVVFMASFGAGLGWLIRLDSLLKSGRVPR